MSENTWPPYGFDLGLPADHQGINDPGNDYEDLSPTDEDDDFDNQE